VARYATASYYLPVDLIDQLRVFAKSENRSASREVERAVRRHLATAQSKVSGR
jgi:hypothetical protein